MHTFMSSDPAHDSDTVWWPDTLTWLLDTCLKLPAGHPARTPGLINSALITGDESAPTKVELWCETNAHYTHPAAYLWTQDPETGDLVEDTTERVEFSTTRLYSDLTTTMRLSTYPGTAFKVKLVHDNAHGAPWDEEDGHGPVRRIDTAREQKRPGERPLWEAGRSGRELWLYDWQAACKIARRDGWNAEPYDAPGRVERAVKADYDRMRAFLRNDWGYGGVVVESPGGEKESLWGIESDCHDYHKEVAQELASELSGVESLKQRIDRLKAEQAEALERAYWASRDVLTTA